MFPDFDFDTAASGITEETTNVTPSLGRVIMIEFDTAGKASVKISNGKPVEATTTAEKVQVYVKLLLRTMLDKYKVYVDTDFGLTYFKYLGRRDVDMDFIKSELQREIIDKIEGLVVVDSVSDFTFGLFNTTLTIKFTINLADATTTTIAESVVI